MTEMFLDLGSDSTGKFKKKKKKRPGMDVLETLVSALHQSLSLSLSGPCLKGEDKVTIKKTQQRPPSPPA